MRKDCLDKVDLPKKLHEHILQQRAVHIANGFSQKEADLFTAKTLQEKILTELSGVHEKLGIKVTPKYANKTNPVSIITTRSAGIISELNKINTYQEKLEWLKNNNLIQPITIGDKQFNVVDYSDRVMVLAKIGKYNIPFYISTGQAGKKSVKAGDWFAVFGIGESGWINKGNEEMINAQYNHPVLQKFAKILNEGVGTIEPRETVVAGESPFYPLNKGFGYLGDSKEEIASFNAQMRLPITPAKNHKDGVLHNNIREVLRLINEDLKEKEFEAQIVARDAKTIKEPVQTDDVSLEGTKYADMVVGGELFTDILDKHNLSDDDKGIIKEIFRRGIKYFQFDAAQAREFADKFSNPEDMEDLIGAIHSVGLQRASDWNFYNKRNTEWVADKLKYIIENPKGYSKEVINTVKDLKQKLDTAGSDNKIYAIDTLGQLNLRANEPGTKVKEPVSKDAGQSEGQGSKKDVPEDIKGTGRPEPEIPASVLNEEPTNETETGDVGSFTGKPIPKIIDKKVVEDVPGGPVYVWVKEDESANARVIKFLGFLKGDDSELWYGQTPAGHIDEFENSSVQRDPTYNHILKAFGKKAADEWLADPVQAKQGAVKDEDKIKIADAKRSEAKRLYKRVNDMDSPTDARGLALEYFAGGGTISDETLNSEVVGSVKPAKLNTGDREVRNEEARARNYVKKTGSTLSEVAHSIWDNLTDDVQQMGGSDDIMNALIDVVGSHNTRMEMAQAYVDSYAIPMEEKFTADEIEEIESNPDAQFIIKAFEDYEFSPEERAAIEKVIADNPGIKNVDDLINALELPFPSDAEESSLNKLVDYANQISNGIANGKIKSSLTGNGNQENEKEKSKGRTTQEEVKAAQAAVDKAKSALKKAEDGIAKNQAVQGGLFGGTQQGMFAVNRDEAKQVLDPLRQTLREAEAELADVTKRAQPEDNSPQLFDDNVPLFSAKEAANDFQADNNAPATTTALKQAFPDAVVVKSQSELPQEVQDKAKESGYTVEGVLYNGQVYLVADNLDNMGRAEGVYRHEKMGHQNVISMLRSKLDKFATSLVDNATKAQSVRLGKMSQALFGKPVDKLSPTQKSILGQEYIAQAAENPTASPTTWQQIVSYVRSVLRDMGVTLAVTDKDVKVLLDRAAKKEAGISTQDTPMFSTKEMQDNLRKAREEAIKSTEAEAAKKLPKDLKRYADNFINFVKSKNPSATAEDIVNEISKERGIEFDDNEADDLYDYIESTFPPKENEPAPEPKAKTDRVKIQDAAAQIGANTGTTVSEGVANRRAVGMDISVADEIRNDKIILGLSAADAKDLLNTLKEKYGSKYLTKALYAILNFDHNKVDLAQRLAFGITIENEIRDIKDGYVDDMDISRVELNRVYAQIQRLNVLNGHAASKALNQGRNLYNYYDNTAAAEGLLTKQQQKEKQAILDILNSNDALDKAAAEHEAGPKKPSPKAKESKPAKEKVAKEKTAPKPTTKSKLNDILKDLKDKLNNLNC